MVVPSGPRRGKEGNRNGLNFIYVTDTCRLFSLFFLPPPPTRSLPLHRSSPLSPAWPLVIAFLIRRADRHGKNPANYLDTKGGGGGG